MGSLKMLGTKGDVIASWELGKASARKAQRIFEQQLQQGAIALRLVQNSETFECICEFDPVAEEIVIVYPFYGG